MEPYELTRQEYLGWAVEQPVRAGAHGEESPDVAPYEQLVVAAIQSGQGVPERVWRQSSLFEHE